MSGDHFSNAFAFDIDDMFPLDASANRGYAAYIRCEPVIDVRHISGLCNSHVVDYYAWVAKQAEDREEYATAHGWETVAFMEQNDADEYWDNLINGDTSNERFPFLHTQSI
jgi:hypothetical protein